MNIRNPSRRYLPCLVLLLLVGCGSGVVSGGSTPLSAAGSEEQTLLDGMIGQYGGGLVVAGSVAQSTDPDLAGSDQRWLTLRVNGEPSGQSSRAYWSALIVEQEYNQAAPAASLQPAAGVTIEYPDGSGGTAHDSLVYSTQPPLKPVGETELEQFVRDNASKHNLRVTGISYIGKDEPIPVVTVQTDDAKAFAESGMNPYFAIFEDAAVPGGYVQVLDSNQQLIALGARAGRAGVTMRWTRPGLGAPSGVFQPGGE